MQFPRQISTVFLIFLIVMSMAVAGCRTSEVSKEQVQELEKVDNQSEKAYQKEYEKAVKKHQKMQSDNTKAMMKQRKQQQKQYNKSQERSFWDRLFKKKCKTEFGNG